MEPEIVNGIGNAVVANTGGLSTSAIVGITLGSVALIIIVIVLAVFIHRRNNKRQAPPVVITVP